jgi:hypothetical protein
MSNIYQLKADIQTTPLLSYRYEGKDITFHSLKGVQPEENNNYLATEHEVINDWKKVCEEALSAEYKESEIPCWEGHYEQFGLVMLNLANMSRYRKDFAGKWNPYYDSALTDDLHELIYTGYSGTMDRIFYRAWFALLGHPDFNKFSLTRTESLNYKNTELELLISFNDLNSRLLSNRKI